MSAVADASPAATEAHAPFGGAKLVLGALFASLGNFMVVLSVTIANVSAPIIAGHLGVSTSEGAWVITSYAAAQAVTVPLTGWLAQRFGQVRVYVGAVAAFVAFSVLCGLAPSFELLVLFRVAQGLAGGPLIPLSATLLLAIFPRSIASMALAFWGMTTVVAPIAGPILGGFICDNWAWPWIFHINAAVGAVVGLGAWMLLADRETPTRRLPFDAVGVALLVVFVGALQIMLDKGREADWFADPFIVKCGLAALLSLVVLVIWELTEKNPAIDLSVFRSRNWLVSTIVLSLMFGLFFGNIVLTPFWLQQQMGYTAFWSGLATAPIGVLAVMTSTIVGRVLLRVDPRWVVTFGMSVLALSFIMRAQLTSQADYAAIALPMLVLGAGVPACIVTLTALGVSDLPPDKVAGGAALQNFFRIVSMAVGASLSQTFWAIATKTHRAELAASVDPARLAADSEPVQAALAERLVEREAVMLATNDFYVMAVLLTLVFALVVWLAPPPAAPIVRRAPRI